MTIEAKLDETNNLLRQLLAAYQSGQQVAGETAATGTRKRRTKAEIEADEAAAAASAGAQTAPVVDGDPAGTVYWASDAHKLVFAQKPGEAAPQGNEFSQVSSTDYLAKKEAFAAAEKAAATQQTSASTEPSATAQQATASGATSGAAEPTWDEVVAGLKSLAQNPAHGATAVMATVQKFKPGAANVPALKDLGQNAAILAHVNSLLNPSASAGAEVDPLFG
ncbi:hypothetical protein Daci_3417 [Delftia acidovorans SPH-1]|uniref:Uncharacterized protein n=1 Tax=Delftia acidovorans (strain DSM 14801 / SPH-1) TaxID=398578 RepID=A9C2B1_DELAS|nr:hypothetical protein [Delftia acidovorans]ABX36055.1 hypothetical protein Daci_3417 [Delftia acidovorans SPH-1]QPS74663.1 hypothetical protein I6G48_29340 [Delftia acidovorans]